MEGGGGGGLTMVKRIKRTQKGLVLTTSPRYYWSIRVNIIRRGRRGLGSVLRCYSRREVWIEKDVEAYAKKGF